MITGPLRLADRVVQSTFGQLPEGLRARVRYPVKRLRLVADSKITRFLDFAPPGHFYSPIPNLRDVESRAHGIRADRSRAAASVGEIDMNEQGQRSLFAELARHAPPRDLLESRSPGRRYHPDHYFGPGDATLLLTMLRHLRPARIIEVGSGFSSAVILDTMDAELPDLEATFVDPHPERLRSLLLPGDESRIELITEPVESLPLDRFRKLEGGDILFLDSSHVAKYASDVCFEISEVFPVLAPGVVIHLHDIFWPFEYPIEWLRAGRAWNEAYMLRAFLQNNDRYEILFFADWFLEAHPDLVDAELPGIGVIPSGSLWLQKLR
jgi:predicted O-methyltransferase YrrM